MNLKKLLTGWLCSMLPKKGKRTIFLTTLFMKLNGIKPGDFKSMQEFNNTIHVVDDVTALKVPCHLYRTIWEDTELPIRKSEYSKEGFTKDEIYGISLRIASMKRHLNKYGDQEKIVKDIVKIFEFTLSRNNGHLPVAH